MKAGLSLTAALAALLGCPTGAQTPLTYELVADGLLDPLAIGAPKGDPRVFIGEHGGVIKVVKDGVVLPTPYLDIQHKVTPPPAGEAGFLGFAFHPQYAVNGYVYVHYTDLNHDTRIERYRVSASNPDVVDPGSATPVLFQAQPSAYHNGGAMDFGPDGYLYIGLGDGGAGLQPDCTGQSTKTKLGKVLRIDVDSGSPYAIPPTNPFYNQANKAQEIYHWGIRNPWRFSIDQVTGDLYFGDVGAATWEEINFAPGGVGGRNFGWPIMEGNACFAFHSCSTAFPACGDPAFTAPILVADHMTAPYACAMVGGEVYRGCAIPDYYGRYFFTDYCDGRVRSFLYSPTGGVQDLRDHAPELAPYFPQSSFITSFGRDGFGEILFVYQATPDFDGRAYRIVPAATPAGLVDCDQNGLHDPCEVQSIATSDLSEDGVPDACQGLSTATAIFKISAGGTQTFQLDAGPAYAGRIYLLGGSITGTAGIPFGGSVIPLTYDPYTAFSLIHPNTPPLSQNLGVLDGAGRATASFSAPGGFLPPVLVGRKAYHAYALFNPPAAIDFASNHVSLSFVP